MVCQVLRVVTPPGAAVGLHIGEDSGSQSGQVISHYLTVGTAGAASETQAQASTRQTEEGCSLPSRRGGSKPERRTWRLDRIKGAL